MDAGVICQTIEGMRVATYNVRVLRPEEKLVTIREEDGRRYFSLLLVSTSHLSNSALLTSGPRNRYSVSLRLE